MQILIAEKNRHRRGTHREAYIKEGTFTSQLMNIMALRLFSSVSLPLTGYTNTAHGLLPSNECIFVLIPIFRLLRSHRSGDNRSNKLLRTSITRLSRLQSTNRARCYQRSIPYGGTGSRVHDERRRQRKHPDSPEDYRHHRDNACYATR